jgi:hypothetical protein
MRRLRFTLTQLMAVVLSSGLGFAALRNADAFWASATFSLAIVSVSVATAAACARNEKGRTPWAGFAIAGGARLVIWLLSSRTVGSLDGPPRPLLYQFQAYINPMASGGVKYIAYTQICNSLDVMLVGLVAAAISHFIAVKDDRPSS